MFNYSASPEEHPFSAGGFAPWPSPSPSPLATARILLCLVAFVAVLFCASLVIAINSIGGLLRLSEPASSGVAYQPMEPAFVCSVKSMECVMGKSVFATKPWTFTPHPAAVEADRKRRQIEDEERAAIESGIVNDPLADAREQLKRENFTEAEMFAMMNMSDRVRHQSIWHYARRELFSGPPFTLGTILDLRDRGFAEKSKTTSLHRLTYGTFFLAEAVADELVKRHRIHSPIIHHTRGAIAKHVNYSCTCGYTRALVAGSRMQEKAAAAHGRHMANIEAVEGIADALSIAPRRNDEEEG